MSRPKWSVPNQAPADGGRSRWIGRICRGSPVHHTGANTAPATMRTRTNPPTIRVGWRTSTRRARATTFSRGLIPDARIQEDIEHVDDEVHQHVDAGDEQEHALDHGIVAADDGVDG